MPKLVLIDDGMESLSNILFVLESIKDRIFGFEDLSIITRTDIPHRVWSQDLLILSFLQFSRFNVPGFFDQIPHWMMVGPDRSLAYTAYKAQALQYCLMPYDAAELLHALRGIAHRLQLDPNIRFSGTHTVDPLLSEITLKTNKGKFTTFAIKDIVAFEANGDICYLVYYENPSVCRRVSLDINLASVEMMLPSQLFFRVHRSYLVHLAYVLPYGAYPKDVLALECTALPEVPLSRRKKLSFHNVMKLFE